MRCYYGAEEIASFTGIAPCPVKYGTDYHFDEKRNVVGWILHC